ncbi:isocitrate/isopropylmalate dehydrogenase family protein [Roseibacillus persicicus]|uniref:isocitrate/isopropylmalate dehydrogenase family protein n=1 Tax=Roseibacillus persicicus TaxID=454148 RepID=UPI00280E01EE|nr:isocitrate/isopropylmalate dehydrogenase family protein [Roseibacillus persicicus]MDQ8189850.1 isocitrate/isopropylmalate dehydrogenase family protein [Roseibacillus persicicus]
MILVSQPNYNIAVLPGDGIGPEVTSAAVAVLDALQSSGPGFSLSYSEHSVGAGEFLKSGNPLPDEAFEACRASHAVLLGAMGLPGVRWPDGREMTPQIDLRERLDLYAGPRPIYLYSADDSPLRGYQPGEIDFVIVRENTEGLFSARGSVQPEDRLSASDVLHLTRKGCERICRYAFEEAMRRRKKCSLVDKANVLPTMVFFREIFDEVAKDFPEVATEHIYVDAAALFLVQRPQSFDVLVTENMFGDILSDLAAGLVGGMGMAPSGDIGTDCAVFQPSHGTAPDIAGQGKANPVGTILSAALMLDWLGEKEAANRIQKAVKMALSNPAHRTPDMGGQESTGSLTKKIIANL